MNEKQRVVFAQRSSISLLFLIPQAARNVLEALRGAQAAVWDDASTEEKVLFAQQEAVLGKFYKAVAAMGRDEWESADEQLQRLIVECEELRTALNRGDDDRRAKEFQKKFDEAYLKAAENPKSLPALDRELKGLGEASGLSESEDQNGEEN